MHLSSRKKYKNISGKVAGLMNCLAFKEFIEKCEKNGLWQTYVSKGGGCLVRDKIARECCFGRGCFSSNKNLAKMIRRTETTLRLRGVLSGAIDRDHLNISRDEEIISLDEKVEQLLLKLSELRTWLNDIDNDLFLIGQ